ncbi:hypothetical protein AVEN_270365-1 [Araneus ventricosus]|uniref:Uncharacterized protein n=1 Tax=Araneus ventricosus TaxID=182803 RepID=A0A4Y2MIM4_ARAVE|nr:hypothetical protein AVEN_270365-1 [Araneus ventricosus]
MNFTIPRILCLETRLLATLFSHSCSKFGAEMPRRSEGTLRGIVKCRASSTTAALIAVREVKPFEVGRERTLFREEDNILSNPVSGTKTYWNKEELTTAYSATCWQHF